MTQIFYILNYLNKWNSKPFINNNFEIFDLLLNSAYPMKWSIEWF